VTDATEDLERRRAALNVKADEHRAKRDKLNLESRSIAEERARTVDELRAKSAEAQDHRHHRDELNEQVREAKRLREEWNQTFQAAQENVAVLKRSRAPKPGATPTWRLRKELKELEFRHMTSAHSGDQEKRILEEMKRLTAAIREEDDQLRRDPVVEKAMADAEASRLEAEKHHAAVGELAIEAQAEHEAMVHLYEEVDELRRKADDIQVRLLEVKGQADEAHRAHIATIEEVRDLEKLLYAARGGRETVAWDHAEPPKEEDFLARLKKGEKVSTRDLLELQKTGRG
jgi:uncharacterized coiled-coil DUF342 family protein